MLAQVTSLRTAAGVSALKPVRQASWHTGVRLGRSSGPCIRVSAYQQPGDSERGRKPGYYPPVPGYTPVEPSAPPMPQNLQDNYTTPAYPGTPSSYSKPVSTSGYDSSPAYSTTSSKPGRPSPLSQTEEQAGMEQELLQQSAGTTRNLSFLAFWVQFALSVVSAGVLLFSAAFVPSGARSAVDISKWLTLVGVAAAFLSSFMAHGFLTLSQKLQAGGIVSRSYVLTSLLTNNTICLGGIALTVIGLQASVGTLVAKSLMTAVSGPVSYASSSNALVSLDVFALQASTNTLLCHVIGLLFTNLMLRIVNKEPKLAKAAA